MMMMKKNMNEGISRQKIMPQCSVRILHRLLMNLIQPQSALGRGSISIVDKWFLQFIDMKSMLLLLSRFSCVRLGAIQRLQPTSLHHPWDSLGKNTGVDCHFLLQCIKVKSEREVAQSCPTLSDPMNYSPPGSPVHGIFQARVLEWGAIAFSGKVC